MTSLTSRPDQISVTLCYHGAPVTLQLSNLNTIELEQTIDQLLKRDGWSAPASAAHTSNAPARRERAQRVTPIYDSHGAPCCPVHKRQLSEGQYGYYCTAKAKDGEQVNEKGYCALRFDA